MQFKIEEIIFIIYSSFQIHTAGGLWLVNTLCFELPI